MRLGTLEITNFRVIRHATLEFDDKVTGIIGPNGSGKSSIIEAIAWALYGNPVARSGKDEIKSTLAGPSEDCGVSLEFEIRGEQYRISRRLVGKSERPEVNLFRGGKPESVGAAETGKHIVRLLGLDWRGFLTSFLARQQELNALATLRPAERRDHLVGMLGIQRLDKALQKVKEDTRLLGQQADMIEKQVAQTEVLAERLAELKTRSKQLSEQRESLSGALLSAKEQFVAIETVYREHQEKEALCSQLQARIETAEKTRLHISNQIEALQKTEAELVEAEKECAKLAGELVDHDSLKSTFEDLKSARRQMEHRESLDSQLKAARAESEQIARKIESIQSDMDLNRKALADLPSDVTAQCAAVQQALEKVRKDWSDCKAEVSLAERECERLQDQLKSIDQIGSDTVCDRCHRPFGDDLPDIREHLGAELTTSSSVLTGHQKKLEDHRREGETLRRKSDEYEKQSRQVQELGIRHEALETAFVEARSRHQAVVDRIEQLKVQLDGLNEEPFDSAQFEQLRLKLEKLDETNRRMLQLKGKLTGLPTARKDLGKALGQLTATESEIAEYVRQRDDLGFDSQKFNAIKADFAEKQQAFDKARDSHLTVCRELELVEKEHQLKTEELERLGEAAKELENCRANRFYSEKLGLLFAEFRKHVISRIRPRLAELSSEIIAEMSGGKYSLVELDQDYNLRVMDFGQYFGVDRFSGGEKDLASLCLRLSISLALTESAGLDRSFVILDEVFGSQDDNRRQLIFEALSRLKSRFPQMLLITHLEELKHKVETLIEMVPTASGWSEVKVNGESA